MPLGYLLPVKLTHLGHSGRGGVVALLVFWRFLSVDVLESLFPRRASAFPTGHIQKPELVSTTIDFPSRPEASGFGTAYGRVTKA